MPNRAANPAAGNVFEVTKAGGRGPREVQITMDWEAVHRAEAAKARRIASNMKPAVILKPQKNGIACSAGAGEIDYGHDKVGERRFTFTDSKLAGQGNWEISVVGLGKGGCGASRASSGQIRLTWFAKNSVVGDAAANLRLSEDTAFAIVQDSPAEALRRALQILKANLQGRMPPYALVKDPKAKIALEAIGDLENALSARMRR